MKRQKIAKILSVLICFLYLSFPIFSFTHTSHISSFKTEKKHLFEPIKKDAPTIYDGTEDTEEEIDLHEIQALENEDFFVVTSFLGDVPSDKFPRVQAASLKVHLPIWLDVRHIIQ